MYTPRYRISMQPAPCPCVFRGMPSGAAELSAVHQIGYGTADAFDGPSAGGLRRPTSMAICVANAAGPMHRACPPRRRRRRRRRASHASRDSPLCRRRGAAVYDSVGPPSASPLSTRRAPACPAPAAPSGPRPSLIPSLSLSINRSRVIAIAGPRGARASGPGGVTHRLRETQDAVALDPHAAPDLRRQVERAVAARVEVRALLAQVRLLGERYRAACPATASTLSIPASPPQHKHMANDPALPQTSPSPRPAS